MTMDIAVIGTRQVGVGQTLLYGRGHDTFFHVADDAELQFVDHDASKISSKESTLDTLILDAIAIANEERRGRV